MKLAVTLVNAKLIKNTQLFGSMDVYATIKIGYRQRRTNVHHSSGKNPVWKQQIIFDIEEGQNTFVINLYDRCQLFDDPIGQASFCFNEFIFNPNKVFKKTIDTYFQGTLSGHVFIQAQIRAKGYEITKHSIYNQAIINPLPNKNLAYQCVKPEPFYQKNIQNEVTFKRLPKFNIQYDPKKPVYNQPFKIIKQKQNVKISKDY